MNHQKQGLKHHKIGYQATGTYCDTGNYDGNMYVPAVIVINMGILYIRILVKYNILGNPSWKYES